MKRNVLAAVFASSAFAAVPVLAQHSGHDSHEHAGHAKMPPAPMRAVAMLGAASGSSAHGTVWFTEDKAGVKVVVEMEGLTPNAQHAIHVHEFGDCTSGDGTSAGGHYNPEGHAHALPATAERHAGDLGNLSADAAGKAHYEITVTNCSIAGNNPILGRAVIVHAKPDDGGQPTGNAGGRIACGVIGAAKMPEPAK